MDISITPINTAGLVRPSAVQPPTPQPIAPIPAAIPKPDNSASQDATATKALISFAQTYAVSDQKFALYKDASGQMITRYVSLRDGSVTYLPAPSYTRPIAPQFTIKA